MGHPSEHVRVVLVPCINDASVQGTRNTGPCITGHPVLGSRQDWDKIEKLKTKITKQHNKQKTPKTKLSRHKIWNFKNIVIINVFKKLNLFF